MCLLLSKKLKFEAHVPQRRVPCPARPNLATRGPRAPRKEAPAAIYPVIDGIFDGDRLAAPAPQTGPGAQRLPVLSCTTVYPLLQTCQCTLLTRFTRRFWRKSGAKLQPFFQPHKFFTHFFQKKFHQRKNERSEAAVGQPEMATEGAPRDFFLLVSRSFCNFAVGF